MGQNDDHIGQEDEDPSRTLDAVKPLYELGSRIGGYKLLSVLGEGGFGTVYLAEQQHPIKRLVALKVIKPGMDTTQVIARFETERQALAMLDHPHIARVFDAGATEAGRPYFAMEYVKGIPITEYCDRYKLGTQERLRLFIPLCQAIQHAHQKGIIHRDIKPSNALVMLHDEKPIPKVIDFGVAKALHQRLTERTVVTEKGEFIGTPEYMSPEQAELTGLDVDTRTDIYSLGVLLYELLTGCTPFNLEDLRSKGYAQMQRIICEQDPVKPSTKLTTLGGKLEDVARQRSATVDQLRKSVRGDLDWIVMKCLEKDRTRRYGTAEALAEDIERHLSHQPVSAGSPGVLYRSRKFVRRHRRVLATAGAFALLLILGTTLSVWQARRAGQAENERASLRNVRWALGTALPEIERSLDKDDYTAAFKLVEQARAFIADNPRFQALSAQVVRVISIETTPPGADVFIRDYNDLNPEWEPIGKSPLNEMKVPRGVKRWKITMPEYEVAEGALVTRLKPVELKVKLDKTGTIAPGMVRVKGQDEIGDFFMDKYEVTNKQFKEFVNKGGYEKREYWKHKFVRDGKEVPWEDAVREFVDATGRPGPATWQGGDIPEGQENHPVSGVSWYEAAAYAEFVGKSLPTAIHWGIAQGGMSDLLLTAGFNTSLAKMSNFDGKGPAPVGSHRGMTAYGAYDMAGNVREWCWNETQNGRAIRGGAWNDATYMFLNQSQASPFDRSPKNGFRCVLLPELEKVPSSSFEPLELKQYPDFYKLQPVSDSVFQVYREQFSYDKTPLADSVEWRNESAKDWAQEKIAFNAAYENERIIAYLFLPKTGGPPYQTVIYVPGDGSVFQRSSKDLDTNWEFERYLSPIVRGGRAVLYPVYKGTFERGSDELTAIHSGVDTHQYTEFFIKVVKDFRRCIDYLQTRPDIDGQRLAYLGFSWGGRHGAIIPAVEERLAASILVVGGMMRGTVRPEVNGMNYVGRVKVPTLMLNGKYDLIFPYELTVKPMFDLLGTPPDQKELKLYDTDHFIPRNERIKETLVWLDRYLGPVK